MAKNEYIKEKLKGYGNILQELENQRDRLDFMEERMTSVGSINYSGMPSGSAPRDKIGDKVTAKIELEEHIKELEKEIEPIYRRIEELIEQLDVPDQRCVLRCRYLDLMAWPDINVLMYMKRVDFLDKEDSYLRKTYRVHGNALENIARILEAEQPETDQQEAII